MKLDDLFRNRQRLFWTLNLAGWAGYTIAAWLGSLAYEKKEAFLAVILVRTAIAVAATIPMRYVYRRLWNRSPLAMAVGILVTCYVVVLAWRLPMNLLYWDWIKHGYRPDHWMGYLDGIMGYFYVMLCWSGLYFGIKYYQQLQQQTEQTLKATAAAHQAQLKMLRYQLNPHFLFNTLNAISTLILDGANETANLAVSRLSDTQQRLERDLEDLPPRYRHNAVPRLIARSFDEGGWGFRVFLATPAAIAVIGAIVVERV